MMPFCWEDCTSSRSSRVRRPSHPPAVRLELMTRLSSTPNESLLAIVPGMGKLGQMNQETVSPKARNCVRRRVVWDFALH